MAQQVFQNLAQLVRESFERSESNGFDTPQEIQKTPSGKIGIDKIYFLHMRMYDEKGKMLPHGGSTIAYKVSEDVAEDEHNRLYFLDIGVANCKYSDKHKDLFCKRIGRDIATARLLDCDIGGPVMHGHPTHDQVIKQVKEMYYHDREAHIKTARLLLKSKGKG